MTICCDCIKKLLSQVLEQVTVEEEMLVPKITPNGNSSTCLFENRYCCKEIQISRMRI